MYKPGDCVIYRVQKSSTHPGPRAVEVHPAAHGDQYSYVVDKYWVVAEVRPDNRLVLKTRRGKEHVVHANDPHLRRARAWERLLLGNRFPKLLESSLGIDNRG